MVRKFGLCALLGLLCVTSSGWAAQSLDGMSTDTLHNSRQTQKMRETWDQEERQLRSQIAALETDSQRLQQDLEQLGRFITTEDKRIAEQHRRLQESKKLREGLLAWLQDVYSRLEQVNNNGLPFLAEERTRRLADLKEVLDDPYAPLYEQFRRVFEVLLVEAEFGHSSEVYRGEIALGDETIQADLLRVGRLALFFRSLDGKRAGLFDPSSGRFRWLENDTLSDISKAFAVVRREAAPEMVALPIGRIVLP